MAERLTRNNKVNFYFHDEASNMVYYKLQGLEDILEKYGIESLDILEQELKIACEIERLKNKEFDLSNSAIVDKDFYKDLTKRIEELKTDRDTWQKACELACKRICYMLDQEMQYHEHEKFNSEEYLKTEIDYFYQQAKKEGENNDTNN